MKYLLDTDHLTFIQIGSGREHGRLAARIAGRSAEVASSIVSFHEQAIGAHALINAA